MYGHIYPCPTLFCVRSSPTQDLHNEFWGDWVVVHQEGAAAGLHWKGRMAMTRASSGFPGGGLSACATTHDNHSQTHGSGSAEARPRRRRGIPADLSDVHPRHLHAQRLHVRSHLLVDQDVCHLYMQVPGCIGNYKVALRAMLSETSGPRFT